MVRRPSLSQESPCPLPASSPGGREPAVHRRRGPLPAGRRTGTAPRDDPPGPGAGRAGLRPPGLFVRHRQRQERGLSRGLRLLRPVRARPDRGARLRHGGPGGGARRGPAGPGCGRAALLGGALGHQPGLRRVRPLADMVRAIADLGLAADASPGILDRERLAALREAGLSGYHHNLETARSFFPRICTTHAYDEDVAAVAAARDLGLYVCSGGIFGLGESWEQRAELLLELRGLGVDSVPVNFLNPIPGTPLEHGRCSTRTRPGRSWPWPGSFCPGRPSGCCGGRPAVFRAPGGPGARRRGLGPHDRRLPHHPRRGPAGDLRELADAGLEPEIGGGPPGAKKGRRFSPAPLCLREGERTTRSRWAWAGRPSCRRPCRVRRETTRRCASA